jgi:hypothetical protein
MKIKILEMKQSNRFFLLGLFVFISIIGFSKSPTINCFYQQGKFVVDGKSDDWGEMAIYDEDTGVITNISNDDKYLYVKIRIGNSGAIQRIFMGGMTLWFDPYGKKKSEIGIVFPAKEDFKSFMEVQKKMTKAAGSGGDRNRMQAKQEKRLAIFNQKYKTGLASITVIDKKKEVLHFEPYNLNDEGLSAILYIKTYDLLFYEARIPLDIILKNKQNYLGNKKKPFSYGFEFGGFEIPEMREEARKMSNQMNTSSNYNQGYNQRSNQRMRMHMQDSYGIIPAIKVWYKKVFLAKK